MITDSSTDKEKGDLKQAVTTNMYFALSDQEKEARVSYCHFLIINVKKKKTKKKPSSGNAGMKMHLYGRDQGRKSDKSCSQTVPWVPTGKRGLEQKRMMVSLRLNL